MTIRYRTAVVGGREVDGCLAAVTVGDPAGEDVEELEAAGLFVLIGSVPRTSWLPDERRAARPGRVRAHRPRRRSPTDAATSRRCAVPLETTLPGVFAIGDVRAGSIKRVATAVGDGATVISLLHGYLAEHPSATDGRPGWRHERCRARRAIGVLLRGRGVLVFLAGLQLFVFPLRTADWFAWTIDVPMTAVFLGASYWSSAVLEVAGARAPRCGPGAGWRCWTVFVFTTLTLVVTLRAPRQVPPRRRPPLRSARPVTCRLARGLRRRPVVMVVAAGAADPAGPGRGARRRRRAARRRRLRALLVLLAVVLLGLGVALLRGARSRPPSCGRGRSPS